MKETTIGGFVMARSYSHIQKYEKEIIERIEKGETLREIVGSIWVHVSTDAKF